MGKENFFTTILLIALGVFTMPFFLVHRARVNRRPKATLTQKLWADLLDKGQGVPGGFETIEHK